jgi:hypothetical protein
VETKTAIPLACILWAASQGWAQQSPAERLIEAGHWMRARTLVEARIREAPDDPLANFLLSQIHNAFGGGRVEADASRRVPDDPAPYYRAAGHLIGAGRDPRSAERYLRTYLAQGPEGNEPTAAQPRRLL